MKKLFAVLVVCLCAAMPAAADHPGDALGLGLILRSGGGVDGFSGVDAGASVKLPALPIFWGFFANINDGYFGAGASGDFYIFDQNLLTEQNFVLDWYLGLGAYASLAFVKDNMEFAFGGRVPVGLSWHINKQWEIFLGAAGNLGLSVLPKVHFPDFFVDVELGFRYWF